MIAPYDQVVRDDINRHEACVLVVYDDATGKPLKKGDTLKGFATIGWGTNLHEPIPQVIADRLRDIRLIDTWNELVDRWAAVETMDEEVQRVLLNMAYNMGVPTLLSFKKMRAALERRDYMTAAAEGRDSRWYHQVKKRAEELMLRFEALAEVT